MSFSIFMCVHEFVEKVLPLGMEHNNNPIRKVCIWQPYAKVACFWMVAHSCTCTVCIVVIAPYHFFLCSNSLARE